MQTKAKATLTPPQLPADTPDPSAQLLSVPEVAGDLQKAARVIENSAIFLAGEVAGGQVTHLMLMAQQLERISKSLAK